MQRERRLAGRAIRKARREYLEHLEGNPFGPRGFAAVGDAMAQAAQAAQAAAGAIAAFASAVADAYERALRPMLDYWKHAVWAREQQELRDRLAFRALEVGPSARAQVTI